MSALFGQSKITLGRVANGTGCNNKGEDAAIRADALKVVAMKLKKKFSIGD